MKTVIAFKCSACLKSFDRTNEVPDPIFKSDDDIEIFLKTCLNQHGKIEGFCDICNKFTSQKILQIKRIKA